MSEITVEQLGELIAQAKDGRVTRENFQCYLRNPERFAKVREDADVFKVAVDYGLTPAEMIAAGHYDRVDRGIHYHATDLINGNGKVKIEMFLINMKEVTSTEHVLVEIDRRGLRPARLAELLAFGAAFPELQQEFPIVALGSYWNGDMGDGTDQVYRHIPCLLRRRDSYKRELGIHCDHDRRDASHDCHYWSADYRFAAVSK